MSTMSNLVERLAGKFIVLDGSDGSGKSTQLKLLAEHLAGEGGQVELVHDPGTTQIGQRIRSLLLDRQEVPIGPLCEMLLFMASRAQLIQERVGPALKAGRIVLCDRFVSATLAYQGALGVDKKTILTVGQVAVGGVWPDVTIILDVPAEEGLSRTDKRLGQQADVAGAAQPDRVERRGLEYHRAVRKAFGELWKEYPSPVKYVDAAGGPPKVFADILTELEKAFGAKA